MTAHVIDNHRRTSQTPEQASARLAALAREAEAWEREHPANPSAYCRVTVALPKSVKVRHPRSGNPGVPCKSIAANGKERVYASMAEGARAVGLYRADGYADVTRILFAIRTSGLCAGMRWARVRED